MQERQRHGKCPTTGERIQLPYPIGTGIRIIDSPFTCAACGETHRLDYPPLQIKPYTLRVRNGIRGGKGIQADELSERADALEAARAAGVGRSSP